MSEEILSKMKGYINEKPFEGEKKVNQELMRVFEEAKWSDKRVERAFIDDNESIVLEDPKEARKKIRCLKEKTKKHLRRLSIAEYDGVTKIIINSAAHGEEDTYFPIK